MKQLPLLKSLTKSIFILTIFISSVCYAGTVRGTLFGVDHYGRNYPAQRIPVTVLSSNIGRSGAAYTDYQGRYYINNVPPGNYILEIWVNPNNPRTINISVFNQPYTNVKPYKVY